ncbi:MAG: condensation domain-containing protein, partial [Solirubrobacteraceae bacterium]
MGGGADLRPLTGAQRGVWMAQTLAPESARFHTADAIELRGPVEVDRLAHAIRTVLDGAEALHARFLDTADGPRQALRPERDWPLERVDLRAESDPAAAADARMARDLRTPIDLATDRLFHAALLRTGDDTWTWYLRIHHIATDAYATALLIRRVADRYTAAVTGADEPPLALSPLESLLAVDAAYDGGDDHAADRAFWSERLAGHATPPTLGGAGGGGEPARAAIRVRDDA